MYCTEWTHGVQQCTVLNGHTPVAFPAKAGRAETPPATYSVDTPGPVHVITALGGVKLTVMCVVLTVRYRGVMPPLPLR
jgi:hypothetical protein